MDTLLFYFFLFYSILPNIFFRYFSRKVRKRLDTKDKSIAITFDDGPDPRYTPLLLDLLKKYDVKCTFFVLGEKAKLYPDLVKRIVSEGHTVGLHANKHVGAIFRSYKATKKDFQSSLSVLKELGITVRFYRPPWGLVNITSSNFIEKYKFQPVLWSLHASDWSKFSDVEHIFTVLTEKVKPGDIILLHDGRGAKDAPMRTIGALETALPKLISQGYKFVIPDEIYREHPHKER